MLVTRDLPRCSEPNPQGRSGLVEDSACRDTALVRTGSADQSAPARASRRRLVCRSCAHQCSVTAGTIFDKTRTPLRVWFAAAWQITSHKHGVSALGLQAAVPDLSN